MKSLRPLMLAMAGVVVSLPAMAQTTCPCVPGLSQVQGAAALSSLLTGRTACAVLGGDRWKERHVDGGALIDYKLGPSDAVDPTKQVGTWATSGSGANTVVTYAYTGGASHTFTVCTNGGTPAAGAAVSPVAFCGPSNIPDARLTAVSAGDVGCGP